VPTDASGTTDGAATRDLTDAALVIAESLDAAATAVKWGASQQRIWVLALPVAEFFPGVRSAYADAVAEAARRYGGLLTDSELARESLERAAMTSRARVEVFPPLAGDRPCPACAGTGVTAGEPVDAPDTTEAAEVVQLRFWRSLLTSGQATGALPYSFAAARMRGLPVDWAPTSSPGWGEERTRIQPGLVDPTAVAWCAASQDRCAARIWRAVRPTGPFRAGAPRAALVTGFDLKFTAELVAQLNKRPDLDVTTDEWPALSRGSEATERLLDQAESILAEWARRNAVWLSRRKRRDQFLIIRLHRYELDSPLPHEIDIENVDAVVYVSPAYGRRIRDDLGWPTEKLVFIPNFLDVDWLDRPKLPEARFCLGMVGLERSRKRFDLALDLLAEVRQVDRRFTLRVRSAMPWDNNNSWDRSAERQYIGWCLARVERYPLLRSGVIFDPPGRDMARWLRQVGHVVSTSDEESFHMAPAEGMASGAVPVLRPWPGAVEIYDTAWIHSTVQDAAAAVLADADAEVWAKSSARARSEVRRIADPELVVQAWADLLHGDMPGARGHFAASSPF
jgi:glycosyltransferase involved in cell wall biosynthesis